MLLSLQLFSSTKLLKKGNAKERIRNHFQPISVDVGKKQSRQSQSGVKACSKRRATAVPNSNEIKHSSSTPFETINRGTAELGLARLLSTASLAVPHGNSTT